MIKVFCESMKVIKKPQRSQLKSHKSHLQIISSGLCAVAQLFIGITELRGQFLLCLELLLKCVGDIPNLLVIHLQLILTGTQTSLRFTCKILQSLQLQIHGKNR